MVDFESEYVSGETTIHWRELTVGVFGGMFLAVWEGLIRLVLRASEWPIRALEELRNGLVTLVHEAGFGLVDLLRLSWRDVIPWLDGAELLALPLAVAIVLLTMLVFTWGVRRFVS